MAYWNLSVRSMSMNGTYSHLFMFEVYKSTRFSSSVYVSAPVTCKWALFPLCKAGFLLTVMFGVIEEKVGLYDVVGISSRLIPVNKSKIMSSFKPKKEKYENVI